MQVKCRLKPTFDLHLGLYFRIGLFGEGAHVTEIEALVEELRLTNGDTARIEAKSGAGGYPQSALESLSALANLPGGGVLIIGLDESNGFQPVSLSNPQTYMQALGNQARLLSPPAQLQIEQVQFEGLPVIVARVRECDSSAKPCRVARSGSAYVRSHDGDFEISDLEEQAFLRLRDAPAADRLAVDGTSLSDLDEGLVSSWRETVRTRNPQGLGRLGDDEMLLRAAIVTNEGQLTKAGLLAFGSYPQQYLPRYVVHVADERASNPQERARNIQTFAGPIPVLLASTLRWFRENLDRRAIENDDGSVREEYEYPLLALRELVANSLVHRDLDAWSEGLAVEVRLKPNRLEITNPGGLYGVTVDRLGAVQVTSARNKWLLSLCENVTDATGGRVVEALATGLTTVARELKGAGLPPARYYDTGIMFTAVLSESVASTRSGHKPASAQLPRTGTRLRVVLDALQESPDQTVEQLGRKTGLSESSVRTALTALRGPKWLLVQASGGRGKLTTYSVTV